MLNKTCLGDDKIKIKTKFFVLFVILITLTGIGCTSSSDENETVSNISESSSSNIEESSSENPDVAWLKSAAYWIPIITEDLKPIVTAVDDGDISEVDSSKLMSDTQSAIEESDKYEVSYDLQFAKIEYDDSMKAFNGAGQVITLGDMENTKKYLTEGFTHMKRYTERINEFNEKYEN